MPLRIEVTARPRRSDDTARTEHIDAAEKRLPQQVSDRRTVSGSAVKLVGVRLEAQSRVLVAAVRGDRVFVLAEVDEFWRAPFTWSGANDAMVGAGLPLTDVELVPPVPASARVICIGLNYRAHAAEGNFVPPEYPTLFGRWTASLSVDGIEIPVPANELGLDWEGEVAAYVGRTLHAVDADTARDAVFGYSTFNDVTARRAQKLTAQWTLGKNADRSGPLGPLVTADEVRDLREGLRVRTRVNGTVVQDGNTREQIYELGDVLSLLSQTFTLHPGDIIATGTPEGVGYVRNPPWLLGDGDVVEVEVEQLGILRNPIVAPVQS